MNKSAEQGAAAAHRKTLLPQFLDLKAESQFFKKVQAIPRAGPRKIVIGKKTPEILTAPSECTFLLFSIKCGVFTFLRSDCSPHRRKKRMKKHITFRTQRKTSKSKMAAVIDEQAA